MSDPASGAGGYMLAKWLWPIAKVLGVPAAGLVGAMLVAAFDPAEAVPDPRQRRKLLAVQYVSALVTCFLFTKPLVRWLDFKCEWFDLQGASIEGWLEIGLPIAFILGALSIGFVGALAKLRVILRDRAADAVAKRFGIDE